MLRPLEYAIMLFSWATLMLIIFLHTQLYGSGTTLPNSEPTPSKSRRRNDCLVQGSQVLLIRIADRLESGAMITGEKQSDGTSSYKPRNTSAD